MIFDTHDLAGAVFLFSEGKELIREMNYSEFEALLDGYVPAIDLANRELFAAYTEINSNYQIKNVVFFLVRFTTEGFVDQSTFVPLYRLAASATDGPNLGYGPIGWVTASQCPIKGFASLLWEPNSRSKLELKALADAVRRNRMSIQFIEPESPRPVHVDKAEAEKQQLVLEQSIADRIRKEYDQQVRQKLEQTLDEQRTREEDLAAQRDRAINDLTQQYNSRVDEYRASLDEHKLLLQEERERNTVLKETIDGQSEKIQGLREYFELKLERVESSGDQDFEALKRNHIVEMEEAVQAATRELNELLQMREVEILYRNEQEAKLHESLEILRSENEYLVKNSGDQLLSSMLEKGVNFVTFQPGAGHITLPVSEISIFMENPTAYVAAHCGVTEAHYGAWLEHYHVPVCQSMDAENTICGENINRVESPANFTLGESDCCHKHSSTKKPRLKLAGSS